MVIEIFNEIEEVKNKNGNRDICQKDLTWYLISKIDKIHDKLDYKVDKKTFHWVSGILFSLMTSLIVVVIIAG